ncbi:response regulator [Luteibaculum oceani]|uniref:Response regulator n=1 Tax=Luteibaculum oceani TaxID=1294296 RepID=A0A5C6V9J3_9FLAO|nr:response regulator [Luteibaculum oceani]TXC81827.1 response regulator [Luteibaculum oceani]
MPYTGFAIIDDDQLFRHILKAQLNKILEQEKSVLSFENGKEAIQYLQDNLPQLGDVVIPKVVFLDINMPIMNGWEFLDEFKKMKDLITEQITIYMITSSVDRRDEKRAGEYSEVNKFVVKPVTSNQLIELLEADNLI